ncbi:MAG TPA: chromate transporter, partial [Stellaceae bacterium]|nr:chromate transporter [Stellaceae bacterium]
PAGLGGFLLAAPGADEDSGGRSVGLVRLFGAFFRLGATSFGGSTASWVYRDFVERRGWLDDRGFLSAAALSQLMPGSSGVNLAVEVGQSLRRGPGACAALLGLLSGPFAIAVALAALYARVPQTPVLDALLEGVAAGAIGLTFATGLRIARAASRRMRGLAFMLATFLAVGVLRWPMLPVLLGLAPLSILFARWERAAPRRGGDA